MSTRPPNPNRPSRPNRPGQPGRPGPGPAALEARGERRRAGVARWIHLLQSEPELAGRFAHWQTVPARPPRWADYPAALDPRVTALLRARGMDRPYAHQARAIELALDGRDVLLATPTASGKTLAYTAPVLHELLATGGRARSLWMFPTKALSQDQSSGLNALIAELGEDWHSYTYDGDTPPSVRRTLRERGHVILTNPWMLHAGILPHHAKWAELFQNLAYVVIDEVHTLGGVFGSSVANVLRRLLRIARHYGGEPRFLLSSATLAEPAAHGRALLGREVAVVDEDGSPAGERVLGVYNPPLLDPVAGLRANALEEARRLAPWVCGPGHQTIFFCNRRTSVEVLTRYLKESATDLALEPGQIRGYRGGYLPLLRREIEAGLRSGEVKVVVTTNALELGIDVGALDVAVLVGYPGSQASFWQRVGRVGRRGRTSLAVMIARSEPVDQFLTAHPEWLFAAPRERIGLDADNLVILSEQLKCAAFELPFQSSAEDPGGVAEFGSSPHLADVLDYLAEESGLLQRSGDTWFWTADAYPAGDVSLAGGDIDNVVILDAETGKALGEIEREGSITTVHEGAIYQVEGEVTKVERFDYENRRAYVRRVESDYFTEAHADVDVRVLRLEERATRARPASGGPSNEDYSVWRGEVQVTTLATLYKKVRFYTRENLGAEDIQLPPEELETEAFALTLSEATAEALGLTVGERGAAWHGVGQLVRRVAPLLLRCQSGDLGLSSQVKARHFRRPTLFLYDRVQGGVGLGGILFHAHREILRVAREVVARCDCRSGCPACVGTAAQVGPEGKRIAERVLTHLAEGPPPEAAPVEAEAGTEPETEPA